MQDRGLASSTSLVVDLTTALGEALDGATFETRAAGDGGAVDARPRLRPRGSGDVRREGPAGVHDRADDGVPARSQAGRAPREEDRQRARLRGGDQPFVGTTAGRGRTPRPPP